MSKVIGFVVCGVTLAACSVAPSLDFLKSSAVTTALRFESVPSGAEVKISGQTCRTPCELKLEVAELSATFALKGYQPQTVAVHSETSPVLSPPRFAPNPVHAELRRVGASARRRLRHETPVATANPRGPVSAEVTGSSNAPEMTAPANTAGWSPGDVR
jgi:PEGA domain-containing protein